MNSELAASPTIAKVLFEGRTTLLHYNNAQDHIQAANCRGRFYEQRQLEFHRDVIPMRSTVLDIGANIGNHTLFYAMHTSAGAIYPFEPNPIARSLLCDSIQENAAATTRINTKYVEFAVGKARSFLNASPSPTNNLGGTKFIKSADHIENSVNCFPLDDLKFDDRICFIKIDVEGMEMDVLAGAANTVSEHRPTIAIEINSRQEPAFWRWVAENDYHVVQMFFDYLNFKNYILVPKS